MIFRAFALGILFCAFALLGHAQPPRPVGAPLATVYVNINAETITSVTVSAEEMRGTFHTSNNGSAVTFTLPDAVVGMNGCFYDLNGAATISLDPQAGEQIRLNGTLASAGEAIDSAGGLGDYICVIANTATTWMTLGQSGTWVEETP